jgi:hypothetical protein
MSDVINLRIFGGCPKMMSLRPIVFTISRHETMGRMMRNHGCVSPVYGDIRPKKHWENDGGLWNL